MATTVLVEYLEYTYELSFLSEETFKTEVNPSLAC